MSVLLKDLVPDVEVFFRPQGSIVAFRTPDGKNIGVRECNGPPSSTLKVVEEALLLHDSYRRERVVAMLKRVKAQGAPSATRKKVQGKPKRKKRR